MNRSAWSLLCIALAASAAVHARTLRDADGNPLGGGRERESSQRPAQERSAPERSAPERAGPAPRAPDAVPPPRPPSLPTPRFGVDRPSAQPGGQPDAPRGDRPVQRPSDPSQGRWSTVRPGQDSNDRDWNDRADPRRDDRSWQRDDWQRDDWQRSRVTQPPRRVYQWRDYDRFRLQHFRFDQGRYFGRSRYYAGSFLWPRGFGVRLWLVGEWLPSTFFLDSRYMLDYWRYGLYQPPAGCRWVRVGDDALLVDDFNGEVLDAIYDLFW